MSEFKVKVKDFDIKQSFECGQLFRFSENTVFSEDKTATLSQKDDILTVSGINVGDEEYWINYLDIERDYSKIKECISEGDEIMQKAVRYGGGIRIFNQSPFETLICFIISQNNNIPRIKGITERLCTAYGEDMGKYRAFPKLEALSNVKCEDLRSLGMGFRDKYICDCVKKLTQNELNLNEEMPTDLLREELMKIKGVGNKVADCVMLFSMGKREVFPIDVWVKRIMGRLYFGSEDVSKKEIEDLAREKWGKYAGYAQQYLFYYARENM